MPESARREAADCWAGRVGSSGVAERLAVGTEASRAMHHEGADVSHYGGLWRRARRVRRAQGLGDDEDMPVRVVRRVLVVWDKYSTNTAPALTAKLLSDASPA